MSIGTTQILPPSSLTIPPPISSPDSFPQIPPNIPLPTNLPPIPNVSNIPLPATVPHIPPPTQMPNIPQPTSVQQIPPPTALPNIPPPSAVSNIASPATIPQPSAVSNIPPPSAVPQVPQQNTVPCMSQPNASISQQVAVPQIPQQNTVPCMSQPNASISQSVAAPQVPQLNITPQAATPQTLSQHFMQSLSTSYSIPQNNYSLPEHSNLPASSLDSGTSPLIAQNNGVADPSRRQRHHHSSHSSRGSRGSSSIIVPSEINSIDQTKETTTIQTPQIEQPKVYTPTIQQNKSEQKLLNIEFYFIKPKVITRVIRRPRKVVARNTGPKRLIHKCPTVPSFTPPPPRPLKEEQESEFGRQEVPQRTQDDSVLTPSTPRHLWQSTIQGSLPLMPSAKQPTPEPAPSPVPAALPLQPPTAKPQTPINGQTKTISFAPTPTPAPTATPKPIAMPAQKKKEEAPVQKSIVVDKQLTTSSIKERMAMLRNSGLEKALASGGVRQVKTRPTQPGMSQYANAAPQQMYPIGNMNMQLRSIKQPTQPAQEVMIPGKQIIRNVRPNRGRRPPTIVQT
ncbi:histone-lysine N-methyltransferase trithorax [Histomonas meleagridis]|uniref:histone-lysine N-methyltransferase trithorax n=1 Tax=Histomonas meleagridis TaxID=135588 RepID=UPI00355A0657|nr:histone-lysine N-methyltransferase trithorax [Histomonas meleagridis]KAH0800542.1 histone-lysine N-methyltransferase trithorax [Histomonas meleagridis]